MSSATPPTLVKPRRPRLGPAGATPAPADHAVAPRPLWNDAAATPNLDAMRRALVADLSRHFPLDPSSTEVGVVLICGDSEDASMDWAGLVLTLPSVADPEDDEENDGEEAGSLWVKPLHMDGPRAHDEKKKRAKTKRGGDLVLVSAEDPPPLSLARPTAPVVRLSVSKDSPVQKIDGAAIMDRLRFTTTELAPAGSGQSLGAVEDRGLNPTKGHDVSRSTVTSVYAFAPESHELAKELSRDLAATGGARPPRHACLPSPRASSAADVGKRKRHAFGHDTDGENDEYTHGESDEYDNDDTPGTTVVFEGTSRQTARRVPGLPAPVSNPLFETNAGSALDFDAESKDGEKDEIGTPHPTPAALGDRAAAVLRDALRSSNAVQLVLPRSDVMCALAEVDEMRSRLKRAR